MLDADALNAFAGDAGRVVAREGRTIVMTPHPARWHACSACPRRRSRPTASRRRGTLAATNRLFVVLKGHRTVIATPDGRALINPTGNPGMATGGTGDVLTGMIAAWLAQLLDAEAACRLAVYLHGAAGDLAAGDEGEVVDDGRRPGSPTSARPPPR